MRNYKWKVLYKPRWTPLDPSSLDGHDWKARKICFQNVSSKNGCWPYWNCYYYRDQYGLQPYIIFRPFQMIESLEPSH